MLEGTNPLKPDTDSDGMPDGWEVKNFLNPNEDDADKDQELDRLSNSTEYELGTRPWSSDTDGDGMKDGWEVENDLDPKDPSDVNEDPDGDGLPNGTEAKLRTNAQSNDTDGDGMTRWLGGGQWFRTESLL